MLEAMSGVPAYIRNGRLDVLTGNALARATRADLHQPEPGRSTPPLTFLTHRPPAHLVNRSSS